MRRLIALALLVLASCAIPGPEEVEAANKARRFAYVRSTPDLDTRTADDIAQGRARLGMTSDQVRASWGEPSTVNRYAARWGTVEWWYYYHTPQHRLRFRDGVLDSIRTTE